MYKKKPKKAPEPTVLKAVITKPDKPKPKIQDKTSALWKRASAVLDNLKVLYPVLSKHCPLCIGISKVLHQNHRDTPTRLINTALYIHTNSDFYLKNLIKSKDRFNLDGQLVEPVDDVGKEKAKILLSNRSVKPRRSKNRGSKDGPNKKRVK
jgi:ProP effector